MLGWERRVFRSQPRPCLKEQCELSLGTMWVHKEGIWDSAVKLDALRGQVKASTQEWYEDKLPCDKMPQNECQVCIYLLICSFKSLLHGVYMAMGKRENKSIYSSQQSYEGHQSFPGGSVVKKLPANAGDMGSVLGLGRSPGEGNDNPLQYPCLENPMDRGAWRATVHGVTKELVMT